LLFHTVMQSLQTLALNVLSDKESLTLHFNHLIARLIDKHTHRRKYNLVLEELRHQPICFFTSWIYLSKHCKHCERVWSEGATLDFY